MGQSSSSQLERYIETENEWRAKLLDLGFDTDFTNERGDNPSVSRGSSVNARNYRRAKMILTAKRQALDNAESLLEQTQKGRVQVSGISWRRLTNRRPYKHRLSTSSESFGRKTLDMGTESGQKNIKKTVSFSDSENSLRCWAGFDGGTEIVFYGDWFTSIKNVERRAREWEDFTKKLDSLKVEAQNSKNPVYLKVGNEDWNEDWEVLPKGVSGGVAFRWALSCGGAVIFIHSNPTKTIPAVRVKLEYEAIAHYPLLDVMAHIEIVLEYLGFDIDNDKVSRADIHCTLRLPFEKVIETYENNRFVTKFRKDSCHKKNGKLQNITWGAGHKDRTVEICIYNKTDQIMEGSGYENFTKMNDILSILGYEDGKTDITRVEFRVFRSFLRECNIDSYFDLVDKLPSLIEYLTNGYFRALQDNKVKGHESEQPLADWWLLIQEGFRQWLGSDGGKKIRRQKLVSGVAFHDQYKSSVGGLTSAFVMVPFRDEKGVVRMMTSLELHKAFLDAITDNWPDIYRQYQRKYEQFQGNLRPLDMSVVQERVDRCIVAREAREKRRRNKDNILADFEERQKDKETIRDALVHGGVLFSMDMEERRKQERKGKGKKAS